MPATMQNTWGDEDEYEVHWIGTFDEDWSGRRVYCADIVSIIDLDTGRDVALDDDWWQSHGAAVQEAAMEWAGDFGDD